VNYTQIRFSAFHERLLRNLVPNQDQNGNFSQI